MKKYVLLAGKRILLAGILILPIAAISCENILSEDPTETFDNDATKSCQMCHRIISRGTEPPVVGAVVLKKLYRATGNKLDFYNAIHTNAVQSLKTREQLDEEMMAILRAIYVVHNPN